MSTTYVVATPELRERYRAPSGTNACDFIHFEDDHCAVMALVDQQPVGVISAKRRFLSPPLDAVLEVFIDIIEVLPTYQRQGIGTALVECVIEWARDCHAAQVRAWSEEIRREALLLWHGLGFTFSRVDFQDGDDKRYGFYVARRLNHV
jgi:GNAT superfamily N-acetyltransferase